VHPILFEVPGLGWPLRSFGVMVAIGFLIGSWILGRLAARYGDDPAQDPARYSATTVWVVAGVIGGARVMYVIVEILRGSETGQSFLDDPLSVLYVWKGGLVMYGGLIGSVLLGLYAANRNGLRPLHALDLGVVAGFVGLALGRVGCLLVGDDHGRVVPEDWQWLPFPVTLRVPDPLPAESLFGLENAGQLLYATQPLMSLKALAVAFLGWQILRRRRYTGQVALWCLLAYAVLRYGVELLRGDTVRGVWFGGALSTSQIVSIAVALGASVLLYRSRDRRDPLPDSRAREALG
jgi:phosphatidylglycerol:prolipoprotein diacylglycerol transferase